MLTPAKEDVLEMTSFDVIAEKVFIGDGKRIHSRTLDSLFD
jgi:hypothetical protein